MKKVGVYIHNDQVVVIFPTYDGFARTKTDDEIFAKACQSAPDGVDVREADWDSVPTNRSEREAWARGIIQGEDDA